MRKVFSSFLLLIVALSVWLPTAQAVFPSPPPAFSLGVFAKKDDSYFESTEILPDQSETVFEYDQDNNLKLIISNVQFSADTTEVSFLLAGDGISGVQSHYFRGETRETSFRVNDWIVHVFLKPLATIQ